VKAASNKTGADEGARVLSFDPLDTAERITGESYKNDKPTEALGFMFAIQHAARKRELLESLGDTYMSMKMPAFLSLMESLSFALILAEDIPDSGDKLRIWWRDGVLIRADSYCGDDVINSGNAYYNLSADDGACQYPGGSGGWYSDGNGGQVWSGYFDIREGMRHRLDELTSRGKFLPTWVKPPFLWLHNDTKAEGYDHKAITASRIARLPAEVQAAISGSAA
jgi:hypothetical protein